MEIQVMNIFYLVLNNDKIFPSNHYTLYFCGCESKKKDLYIHE